MEDPVYFIDGFGPLSVTRPQSAEEIGDLVRRVAGEGQGVYPFGGRTQIGLGLPPTKPGIALDLRSLNAVVDYPARDMTVTVQAGITIADLQRLLAAQNQRLSIDVPRPEEATLGGTLAANVCGPRRFGFGTLRDYVLGMSFVNDQGQEVKAGGRVVKNVAGYDLHKLHIGALGTLGVITQVTLKLRPLPEATVLLAFSCNNTALESLLDRLHESRTRPVCLDLLNAAAAREVSEGRPNLPKGDWVVVVGFEDNNEAVCWQVRQLMEEVAFAGIDGLEARAGESASILWQKLTEYTLQPASSLGFKANLLPQAVASFCLQVAGLAEGVALHAHAGSGIVRGFISGSLTLEWAEVMLNELRKSAVAAKGNIVLPHCPTAWKRSLPVWGRPRDDAWLMRRVKDVLDPGGVFNPNRLL